MKEKISKLASLNQEVVDLLKEDKKDEAIEKIAEIQTLTKEMEESAVETPADQKTDLTSDGGENKEEIEKAEKIAKAMDLLEKYASLNITAETIKDLMDQFGQLKDQMTQGLDTITKRLDVVENAKGISKQANEDITKSEKKSLWDGVL